MFCVSCAEEPAISDFEAQLDRLNVALQRWQQAEQQLQPLEDRLWSLTDRGADIVSRLAAAEERQAQAVSEVEARLGEWHTTERRLHQDSLERIRTLERTMEQEWRAIRHLHEEPLRLLREQAAALGETSVAAASLSLRGYERAEARLAALESDLRTQLGQLTHDIQSALADIKAGSIGAPAALPAAAPAPFPLDRVMRIHDNLRDGASPPVVPPAPAAASGHEPAPPAGGEGAVLQLPASSVLSQRVEELERELSQEKQDIETTVASTRRLRRNWRMTVVAAVIGAAIVGTLGMRFQEALGDASARAETAERQAAERDREIAAARAETAAVREAAARAELLGSILAAPDVLRFRLTGTTEMRAARAVIMWSRSTGVAATASALPAAPTGSEYQIWLLTTGQPVRAGVLAPDASGRASFVATTPAVPRPVDGVAVTLEAAGATGRVPAGVAVLTRATVPAP